LFVSFSVHFRVVKLGDSAAEGGSFPKPPGFSIFGFVLHKPVEGVIEADGLGKGGGVGELKEDESRRECVAGEAADGFVRPGAIGLLEVGQVMEGALDSEAGAAVEEQGPKADGGGDRVAPAAVSLLEGKDGS